MNIDLSEIPDWRVFENLIAGYLESVAASGENNITRVEVKKAGDGSDGGKDLLVTFEFYDSIVYHTMKWVVQCKFQEKAVSKSHLATVNIPSLIHEHGADGYILVCKNRATTKVVEMFENLRRNCKFNYEYQIWMGSDVVKKNWDKKDLIRQYFPKYRNFAKDD